jgi:hypothetical protein
LPPRASQVENVGRKAARGFGCGKKLSKSMKEKLKLFEGLGFSKKAIKENTHLNMQLRTLK